MKKNLSYLLFPLFVCFLSGCTHYTGLTFTSSTFKQDLIREELQILYTFDYLHTLPSNELFSAHADKSNIQVIAMEIENKGIEPIELGRTHFMNLDGTPVPFLDTDNLYQATKMSSQGLGTAFLVSPFLGLAGFTDEGEGTETNTDLVIALAVLGPVTVLFSAFGMMADNSNLKSDLIKWNLFGRTIQAGETVRGLVAVKHTSTSKPEQLSLFRMNRF